MGIHITYIGVLLAAAAAMIIGTLWYSPFMFGKEWSKISGVTDKVMKKNRNMGMIVLAIVALMTAYTLNIFIFVFHGYVSGGWFTTAVEVSLIASIGFALTAIFAHGILEPRDSKILFINSGNRIVTFVVMGLIIAAFLR